MGSDRVADPRPAASKMWKSGGWSYGFLFLDRQGSIPGCCEGSVSVGLVGFGVWGLDVSKLPGVVARI